MKNICLIIFIALSLTACIKPYQPDIQQGNIINNSDLNEIQIGMNKQEVLFILGTPMVVDPFNKSRWEYYYSNINKHKNETTTRLITMIFNGDVLASIHGDINADNLSKLEPSKEDMQHGGTVITKPTQKEKGLFSRFFKRK